jgi:DegV family protein with EDD domain
MAADAGSGVPAAAGNGIAVVMDSCGYLPPAMCDRFDITVVPLWVVYPDGHEEHDGAIEPGPYFESLGASAELPTTRAPSVEEFVDIYRPLLADGKDIVSIHISSAVSETCSNARQAAAQLAAEGGSRIHVVDSASGAGTVGVMAIAAARRAAAGRDVVDVVNLVSDVRAESRLWFALDTLEFLRRGGRLGGAAAWMGTTLKIKPILTMGSTITAVERVRTWERAVDRMVDYGRQLHDSGADAWFVHHAANKDDADVVVERLQDVFWRPPEFVTPIGAVVGTHLGPRIIGVGGCPARFIE